MLGEVHVLRSRHVPFGVRAVSRNAIRELHELAALRVGERVEDHPVEQREDGGAPAQAECQGENGDRRERGVSAEPPYGDAEVVGNHVAGDFHGQ